MSNVSEPELMDARVNAGSVLSAGPMRWWMLLLVAVVAGAAYANSLANGFAFDDVTIVRDNPHVIAHEWTAIWTDNYWPSHDGIQPDALYRPLTLWTYLANQVMTPGGAWAFHLVNVLLHGLVTVLVALLAWRIFASRGVAVVTGLLFAVHPLHTEAVANTVGRAELLAGAWSLLTLLVFLPSRPLVEETGPQRRPWWHGLIVAGSFLAAMLSKETPATLLVAVPCIDVWRWARWERHVRPSLIRWLAGQGVRYYLPMAAVFGIYLALRINACGLMTDVGAVHPIVNLLVKATPGERIITPFALLAQYLALTFWPVHLSADYSAPSLLPTSNPLAPLPAAGILLCILAVVAGVKTWRRYPQVMLVLGLFLFSYALVSNVLRIGTIFGERLFYLPSAFILMLASWAAVQAWRELPGRAAVTGRWVGWGVVAGLCVAMGIRTYVRNTDWSDNLPLAVATARDNPRSAKACFWAGNVLVLADKPEFVEIGLSLLERSCELYPDFAGPYWEIAKYYGRQGQLGKSAVYLARAVRLDPGGRETRVALPAVVADLRRADPATYMPDIEKNRDEHPEDPTAYLALALAYHGQAKYDLAESSAEKALELGNGRRGDSTGAHDWRDQFHEAAAELATIRYDRGHVGEAVDMFRQYVVRMRNSVEARCTMATMLLALDTKEYPRAVEEAKMNLDRAAFIDPGNAHVRELRGVLTRRLATPGGAVTVDAAGPPVPPAQTLVVHPNGGTP